MHEPMDMPFRLSIVQGKKMFFWPDLEKAHTVSGSLVFFFILTEVIDGRIKKSIALPFVYGPF